nr:MAG TPA: hypothetical protein [Caudoviricetes sp.]
MFSPSLNKYLHVTPSSSILTIATSPSSTVGF